MRHWSVPITIALFCACALSSNTSLAQAADPPLLTIQPAAPGDSVSAAYAEVDTLTQPVGKQPKLCWAVAPVDAGKTLNLVVRRYRLEGGPRQEVATVPYAQWGTKSPSGQYCSTIAAHPMAGHWIYEAQLCTPAALCSDWIVTVSAGQGWWVYAYLETPGGVEVN